jgi:Sugar (and other) transporter
MQLNLSRRLDAIDDKPRVLLLDKVQRSHHINTKKMTAVMTSSPVTIDDVKERRRGTSGETLDDDIVFKSNVDGVYSKFSAFAIFFFPAVGGLLYGYDIGATSAVVTQLKSINYSGVQWHATIAGNSSLRGVITAMSTLGALIGSIACFCVADLFGRRRCLLLATSLYLIGAVLEVVSGGPVWNATTGIAILLLGRLIYGLGCGFTMVGAPAYIGEMAPPAIRG